MGPDQTHGDHAPHETEEYLEVLYRLEEEGIPSTVKTLAGSLRVREASASEKIARLVRAGFVSHRKYGTVMLTAAGRRVGKSILRKHRIAERLLGFLEVKEQDLHREACELEHHISDRTACAILDKLPLGETLSEVPGGKSARVLSMEGEEKARRRIMELGITRGETIRVLSNSSGGGALKISVRGSVLALGRGLADKITVERAE